MWFITANPSQHGYGIVHVNYLHNSQHSTTLNFKIYFSEDILYILEHTFRRIFHIDSLKIMTNSGHT